MKVINVCFVAKQVDGLNVFDAQRSIEPPRTGVKHHLGATVLSNKPIHGSIVQPNVGATVTRRNQCKHQRILVISSIVTEYCLLELCAKGKLKLTMFATAKVIALTNSGSQMARSMSSTVRIAVT